jgi:hypothetical protein
MGVLRRAARLALPGQALVETALLFVPVLVLILAFVVLTLSHRVVTAAEAAAYACAAAAASEPLRAAELGWAAARETLGGWSGVVLEPAAVQVEAGGPGGPVRCRVAVRAALPAGGLLSGITAYEATYEGRREALRGRW